MPSKEALKSMLRQNLMHRGLRAVQGRLAFSYKGQIVDLEVDESPYRGTFIAVLERGRTVREFRAQAGTYDWNAIALTVMEVADARTAGAVVTRASGVDAVNRKLVEDLRSIIGGASTPLTIEASSATPGRVRVKVDSVELDPVSVLQLFAALSRNRPEAAAPHAMPAI